MSGVYIHIPFCNKKCHYCDFHISTSLKNKDFLIKSILTEIELRSDKNTDIKTIYFGGGTPSLLPFSDLNKIVNHLYKYFKIEKSIEFTLEANPEDLNIEYLKNIKNIGINRLSIGVQSFLDRDLKFMNRIHSSKQAEKNIKLSQDIGLNNISVDLIYGIPNQTKKEWESNIDKVILLETPHISSYALTVEKKTVLNHFIKKGDVKIEEDDFIKFHELLVSKLESNSFIPYEISNFSKKGFISNHNSNYWKGKPYIGIGPSAHSFDGKSIRRWNISNNNIYIKNISKNEVFYEKEILTTKDIFNEHIMTSLRTIWGVDIDKLKNISLEYFNKITPTLELLKSENKLKIFNNNIIVAKDFLFFTDGIISELFV